MNNEQPGTKQKLSREVAGKEARKLEAVSTGKRSVWAGMGLFGMIGWSVVVPALLGAALGRWLDKKQPVSFSWTLTLLVTGIMAGCVIAWNWVAQENKDMHQKQKKDNHE